MSGIRFGFQAAAAGENGQSDAALYRDLIADCELGYRLGYDSAWFLEHHFSDYHPTPSPLLLMSHVAARLPDLSLGTAVLVLPWYHPLRLAEDIAMLNSLTRGTLHLGIGRGTARMEYDAYNVDMNEARARFAEIYKIVLAGLSGKVFTHSGRFWNIRQPVRVRPAPVDKPVQFYGAIGSPGSAEIMADLGVAPICLATFPDSLLLKILERWRGRTGTSADRATLPISIRMIIADTDEEAFAIGRKYLPQFFALQADHYEADSNPWSGIPEYEDFNRMFSNLRKLADPSQLDPFFKSNLIGSTETICKRMDSLAGLGFNYFVVSASTPGMPLEIRQRMLARFARDVCPRYAKTMQRTEAA